VSDHSGSIALAITAIGSSGTFDCVVLVGGWDIPAGRDTQHSS